MFPKNIEKVTNAPQGPEHAEALEIFNSSNMILTIHDTMDVE